MYAAAGIRASLFFNYLIEFYRVDIPQFICSPADEHFSGSLLIDSYKHFSTSFMWLCFLFLG